MVWHSPDWATVEQSTHWARLVGSGPTVQLRRIQRFGCTESLLELSSQKRAVLNQTSADTIEFPGSLSRGGQPTDWTIHSPLIEVKSTTPAKSKEKRGKAASTGATYSKVRN